MFSLRHFFRRRSLRLALGLGVAVATPVGGLVLAQYRSLQELERTSVMVLDTLSNQVADSLVQALRSEFERPAYEIERIDHFAIDQRDLPRVMDVLRRRGPSLPTVDAFYLWGRRGGNERTVLELLNARSGVMEFADAGPESRRLLDLTRELARSGLPWGTAYDRVDGRMQAIVLHLLFASSARERVTSFIGFRVDLERFRTEGFATLLAPLVAAANRKTGLATLVADVVDQDGREVYQSHPRDQLRVHEERRLPLVFFAPAVMRAPDPCPGCLPEWRLRVGYLEGTAGDIALASTTSHRTLLVALAVVLALGVIFAVRTALKEMQLAEAKSHFVASVSHDLKTPLALIQLFAETLELGRVKSADRAREYYAIINREAKTLGALISNVLDFSRIESGLRMYRLQPVDLGRVARHVLEGFTPQIAHEGFTVRLRVSDDLPVVPADEEAVGLAVANLVSNAMKYSGDSREIAVTVAETPRGVTVSVADHGLGIAWRHQRRIFQKFYRVEDDAPGAPPGCGLGLAIVEQVMRAHRGRVLLDSEPGRGSVFTLVFPSMTERRRDEAHSGDRRRASDAAGAA
jgi:signal transduction histidine kinase